MKCWCCQKMGHYAVVCPEKKKKGKNQTMAASAEIEDFSDSFDREFGFIACESTRAGAPATEVQRVHFPRLAEHLRVSGMWTVGLHVI